MNTYLLFSGQTGSTFASIDAKDENDAIDSFAQKGGFKDRQDMWSKGVFEYISAVKIETVKE